MPLLPFGRARRRPTVGRAPVGVAFALGLAALLACSTDGTQDDDNQFRDDVIWCEEAAARLERCCPGFDARWIACRFEYDYNAGCGATTTTLTEPAFTKEESTCVRATSCSSLVDEDVCARAADAGAVRVTKTRIESTDAGPTTTKTDPPPRSAVCP